MSALPVYHSGWRDARVLSLDNSFQTLKNDPGSAYAARTLADVLTCAPAAQPKGHGPAVLASSYTGHDGRSGKAIAQHAKMHLLWCDLDANNPDPNRLIASLLAFAGEGATYRVYSTASSTPADRRLRGLLPLADGVSPEMWITLQEALILHLERDGFTVDHSSARLTQPIYLPNAPAGSVNPFESWSQDGPGMCVEVLPAAVGLVEERRRQEREHAREAAEIAAQRRTRSDETSVITAWSAKHDLESALENCGFEQKNPGSPHWRSPLSKSGSFAVRVYGDRAFSLHQHDADAGLGVPANGGRVYDSFDLFVHFEHDGNFKAAVRAAAKSMHMEKTLVAPENGETAEEAVELDIIESRLPPWPAQQIEYGILNELIDAATAHSEATRSGVLTSVLVNASMLMRPFYTKFGDDGTASNLLMVLIGPSAHGRKGTSMKFAGAFFDEVRRQFGCAVANQNAEREAYKQRVDAVTLLENQIERARARLVELASVPGAEVEVLAGRLVAKKTQYAQREDALFTSRAERDARFGTASYEKRGKIIATAEAQQTLLDAEIESLQQEVDERTEYLADPVAFESMQTSKIAALESELQEARRALAVAPKPMGWATASPLSLSESANVESPLVALAQKPETLGTITTAVGLMHQIRDEHIAVDPVTGDEVVIPGVEDKRLLLDLEEFSGLISSMRTSAGAGISELVRSVIYDGKPYANSTKTTPTKVAEHHISILGNCTPAELIGIMFDKSDRAATSENGFGNRFMYLFSRGVRSIPNPPETEGMPAMAAAVVANVTRVYEHYGIRDQRCRQIAFPLSDGALEVLGSEESPNHYSRLKDYRAASTNAQALTSRFVTNLRKVAVVMSIINGEVEVSREAILAAVALIDHSAAVLDVIAATRSERVVTSKMKALAQSITEKLAGAEERTISLRELMRALRPAKPGAVRDAVEFLIDHSPPIVELIVRKPPTGGRSVALVQLKRDPKWS